MEAKTLTTALGLAGLALALASSGSAYAMGEGTDQRVANANMRQFENRLGDRQDLFGAIYARIIARTLGGRASARPQTAELPAELEGATN